MLLPLLKHRSLLLYYQGRFAPKPTLGQALEFEWEVKKILVREKRETGQEGRQ